MTPAMVNFFTLVACGGIGLFFYGMAMHFLERWPRTVDLRAIKHDREVLRLSRGHRFERPLMGRDGGGPR